MKGTLKLNEKSTVWIFLIISVAVFLGLGLLFLPSQPTFYTDYVTDSPSPSGTKGIYTLIEREYDHVGVWGKSVDDLSNIPSNQFMIMVEPYTKFDPIETDKWIEWIGAGNRLLIITESPEGFFNIKTTSQMEIGEDKIQTIYQTSPQAETYQGEVRTFERLVSEADDQILLQDEQGIIALSRSYGKGELTVLLTPDWLTNESILEYDHLQMLLPLITPRESEKIWFNDFIHGSQYSANLTELYPKWFLILFAQGIIILLIWLWYKGRRFGPMEIPREWVIRFGDERIRAISAWYLRGGYYKESLMAQDEYLRHVVQDRWKIPATIDRDQWIKTLTLKLKSDKQNYWLESWKEFKMLLSNEKISHKDYYKWSKRLNELKKEVEQA